MKKYAVSLFAILCVCLAVISCKEAATYTINDAIKEIQKDLPEDMGDGLTLSSVELGDNAIVMKMECPDEMVSALSFVSTQEMKEAFVEGFKESGDEDGKNDFINLCKMAEKGLSIIVVGTGDEHPEYHVDIPYDEISKLKN